MKTGEFRSILLSQERWVEMFIPIKNRKQKKKLCFTSKILVVICTVFFIVSVYVKMFKRMIILRGSRG